MKEKRSFFRIIVFFTIIGLLALGCENPSGGGKDKDIPIIDTPINNGDNPPSDPVFYTVTFDSNGGSAVDAIQVQSGNTITIPAEPTRGIDTFDGWYTDNNTFVNAFTASTTVTANITVYAKWIKVYEIGDTGPAGGLIFYVNPNAASDGWQYLEAAPKSTEFPSNDWGPADGTDSGTETDIGSGEYNTQLIVAQYPNGSYTANRCDALDVNGFDDWFLPSKDELNLMYNNLHLNGYGEFVDDNDGKYYVSSSQAPRSVDTNNGDNYFWGQAFFDGSLGIYYKNGYVGTSKARAIRQF